MAAERHSPSVAVSARRSALRESSTRPEGTRGPGWGGIFRGGPTGTSGVGALLAVDSRVSRERAHDISRSLGAGEAMLGGRGRVPRQLAERWWFAGASHVAPPELAATWLRARLPAEGPMKSVQVAGHPLSIHLTAGQGIVRVSRSLSNCHARRHCDKRRVPAHHRSRC